jgi:hypothetical protein
MTPGERGEYQGVAICGVLATSSCACNSGLRRINRGDVTIRHHWTGDCVTLHSFRHKGYWFHGKDREWRSLESIARFLGPRQTAFDIGGHIGYIALYFGHLVGPAGRVYTFEPGPNNLPYIRQNIRTSKYGNIILSEEALGHTDGSRVGTCILNTGPSLDHDNSMADFSSLAPAAVTGGGVSMGVCSAICIGDYTVIGAGATVLHDVPDRVVAYGTSAHVVRTRLPNDPYLGGPSKGLAPDLVRSGEPFPPGATDSM